MSCDCADIHRCKSLKGLQNQELDFVGFDPYDD